MGTVVINYQTVRLEDLLRHDWVESLQLIKRDLNHDGMRSTPLSEVECLFADDVAESLLESVGLARAVPQQIDIYRLTYGALRQVKRADQVARLIKRPNPLIWQLEPDTAGCELDYVKNFNEALHPGFATSSITNPYVFTLSEELPIHLPGMVPKALTSSQYAVERQQWQSAALLGLLALEQTRQEREFQRAMPALVAELDSF